jgi:hypothetical protein
MPPAKPRDPLFHGQLQTPQRTSPDVLIDPVINYGTAVATPKDVRRSDSVRIDNSFGVTNCNKLLERRLLRIQLPDGTEEVSGSNLLSSTINTR